MNESLQFVDDMDVPGLLRGLTIRSPIPKGRLLSIEAPRLPGSYHLIRGTDIPGRNRLEDCTVPILADERLSYIGEPIALLIGPDAGELEELAAQCRVTAQEESPVFSSASCPPEAVLAQKDIRTGDTEAVFREAKTVVEGLYTTGIQEHWCSEPSGALAVPEEGKMDSLRIYTAAQWPFQVRRAVAAALNIPPHLVIVEPARMGVHLDGKVWYPSLLACHAALGARITGKPVKIALSREEDVRYGPKRNGAEIRLRSALGDRGQVLATEVSAAVDLGAHGVFTYEILDRTCLASLGLYKHGVIALRGVAAATNTPPAGPLEGFGLSQGFFAAERHIAHIAGALGQDPVEWRKNNLFSRNKALVQIMPVQDTAALDELLDTALVMGDYRRKWASYELLRLRRRESGEWEKGEELRGIGVAAAYQGGGFLYSGADKGNYAVELTLEKDGALEIRTGIVSSHQEYQEIWRKIAGDMLSVNAAAVRFVSGGTDRVPDSGPACLSRNITVITKLVERACMAIRKQRFRDPLPITVRRSYHPGKGLNQEGKPVDQNAFARLSWGAAAVEAAIDPITYAPRIRGAWLAVDGGRILAESRARRSLKLRMIHALSWASRERLSYEGGLIPEKQIRRYDIPLAEDRFPIHIEFIRNDGAGPKGIGELAFNCVPAAYAQAVSQAMDYHFSRLPISAQDIWEADKLRKREKEL